MFLEQVAPRAGVYNALPNVVTGVVVLACTNLHLPERQSWTRLQGSSRSQEFSGSHTDTEYDADYLSFEAGTTFLENGPWQLGASLHLIDGDADVRSLEGKGDVDMEGKGVSFHAHYMGASGYYLAGRTSVTRYDMDLSSENIAELEGSLDADGVSVHVEAGRHGTISPRARLHYTDVSIDSFTDAVNSRVSFSGMERYAGSVGLLAMKDWGLANAFVSLDYEQVFSGKSTSAKVQGEVLRSRSQEDESVLLAVGGTKRNGPWILSTETHRKGLAQFKW